MQQGIFQKQPHHPADLLTHLQEQFKEAGNDLGKLEDRGVSKFLKFAQEYLDANRPIMVFPEENNYGVVLSNNYRVIISPKKENQPGVQSDGSVAITNPPA